MVLHTGRSRSLKALTEDLIPPNISQEEIKKIIITELPKILKRDPGFRDLILRMTKEVYADKKQTEGRIERILDGLKRDREGQRAVSSEQRGK